MNNGDKSELRADIGMRLIIDASSYGSIGELMDAIAKGVEIELKQRHAMAAFDFTHFNTYPCKAARMDEIRYANMSAVDMDAPSAPAIPGAGLTQH